jgi:hypothetical protein
MGATDEFLRLQAEFTRLKEQFVRSGEFDDQQALLGEISELVQEINRYLCKQAQEQARLNLTDPHH